jgi:hypothetical protein
MDIDVEIPDWHIRISFERMSAITEFSRESGLVTAQSGTRIQDLADWLMDKGYALPVRPEFGENPELWEFLLCPGSGSYGPRYGDKWQQVFALSAILPSGRIYRNSLSPARATGPDFAAAILGSRGTLGIPLEVTLKVRPIPARNAILTFALSDLVTGVERAWHIARLVKPEFLEVGLHHRHDNADLPACFLIVELWDRGSTLAGRKELIRKTLADIADPVTVPYEVMLGFEDTYQFDMATISQFRSSRTRASEIATVYACSKGANSSSLRLRLQGFVDGHASVTVDSTTLADCREQHSHEFRSGLSSSDGATILARISDSLDPGGVFGRIPDLWKFGLGGQV